MKYIYKTIFIFSLLVSTRYVFAGDISLGKLLPATSDIKVGDEVLVELSLISHGTEYNAIEGSLVVPEIFEISKVITGNSLVSVWLDNPSDVDDNTITFSGIAPAGYNREIGPIFSLVLSSKSPGRGVMYLKNARIYKNDGLGTKEDIVEKSFGLSVRTAEVDESPYLVSVKDETPPEEFAVELVRDSGLYDGRYTIVWSAVDKGSGIKSYDVVEGRHVFKQVKSPYVLEKQSLSGKIYVKAYDYEGNIRSVSLVPPGRFCVGDSCFGKAHIFAFGLVVVAIIYVLWKKKKRSR